MARKLGHTPTPIPECKPRKVAGFNFMQVDMDFYLNGRNLVGRVIAQERIADVDGIQDYMLTIKGPRTGKLVRVKMLESKAIEAPDTLFTVRPIYEDQIK